MKKNISVIIMHAFIFNASAQINESDKSKFQLGVRLNGSYQKGNVDVFTVKSKLDIVYSPIGDFVFKSQNSHLYQEFYSKKADNDIFSRNYFYYKPQHKVYPFCIGYISANYRRKVDFRYFVGAGATWQLLRLKNHILKLSASAVYELTKFTGSLYNYSGYDGSDKINVWRGTLYVGGWSYVFENHLRLYYDAYWQPAVDRNNNYRTQFEIGADFPVWKGLSFNALYTFTHEHVVISTVKQDDRMLTFGVAYNLTINK
jgi:hypothetical protein